jgi:hypothetical protein
MDKKITLEQIEAIINEFYRLNAPVQNFEAVKKLLLELPPVTEVNVEKVQNGKTK